MHYRQTFQCSTVKQVTEQIEEVARLSDKVIRHAQESLLEEACEAASPSPFPQTNSEIDVREVSQRFRRLLARLQSREDLVRAFADSLQEQFDVDNVVVLLPATGRPVYEIGYGDVIDEVRSQFSLPFNDPLLKSLIRLGEPVWVYDCERLGRVNACAAIRCGERLNIQILCPVLYRGRLKAVIGLSRLHRYTSNPALLSLLRLFLTFFSEALENSYLYEKVAADGEIHRAILEAFESGMVAVSSLGMITYVNPAAESILGLTSEMLLEQPVEKAGSIAAHHARTCLEEGKGTEAEPVSLTGKTVIVSAMPLAGKGGVFLTFCRQEKMAEHSEVKENTVDDSSWRREQEQLWNEMVQAIAHNFKNAFVPVQTCAELLPSRYQDKSFRDFFMATVGENIERINKWIEQLLGFSHLGEVNGEHSSFSLHEVIESGMEDANRGYPQSQVEFKVEYGLEDKIEGNRKILENAFAEIVRNAIEAVQDVANPAVRVGSQVQEERIEVTIEDNGEGLTEDVAGKLFRPFTSTKLSGNLGLGLAYAYKAITGHGGSLQIEPGEKKGTRVRIILPQTSLTDS